MWQKRITLTVGRRLTVVSAVAVERPAAAGRRRRRIGRTVLGETVVTVRMAVRMVSTSDAHSASDVVEMLARLVQRETLHPQVELLVTARTVRRCCTQEPDDTSRKDIC